MPDLGCSWSAITRTSGWLTRMLIGGLLSLIPFVGSLALWGYSVETGRRAAAGDTPELPSWAEIGRLLARGGAYFLLVLVYSLPLAMVALPIGCMAGALMENRSSTGPGVALLALFYLVAIPASLILRALCDFALLRYIETGRLGAALNVGAVIGAARQEFGTFLFVFALRMLASTIALMGFFALGLGLLITVPFSEVFFGHALGQLARQRVSAPASTAPTQRITSPLSGMAD